ncbi:MAG: N5-glutamine S-adenosyl-L-methionine-dependent methyltransferase, partial [Pyrinomonadaceae bacterium]
MNISSAIVKGSDILNRSGIDQPRREASSLLAFALGKDDVYLIAHPEYELDAAETAAFDEIIHRRASREPFHYIVGRKEFFGL